ncbi:MAG: hypothetical protein IPM63_10950 [Acidobacteriota bacterium]|nr:MAG: hypothetical protein IPM63_10950 [Acidobacteriota bacterium]
MRLKKFQLVFLSLLLVTLSAGTSAQKERDSKAAEEYQNRQRALSLILLDSKIKSLDDAPMRCLARIHLVESVLEQRVPDLKEHAISSGEACLEDIRRWPEEFDSTTKTWLKARLLRAVRKYTPDDARRLEKLADFHNEELAVADESDVLYGGDVEGPFNRLLARLRSGEIPVSTSIIISKLRERDPGRALEIMSQLLLVYESRGSNFEFENTLSFVPHEYLSDATPVEMKKRFLRLVVKLSSLSLQNPENQFVRNLSRNLLQVALPHFQSVAPELADTALALKATLDARQTDWERALQEINDRIGRSDDKLAQTIEEAKNAESEGFANQLWQRAAYIAVREKKFVIAVDSIMNVKQVSKSYDPRPYFIKQSIVPNAIKVDDLRGANYAISRLEQDVDKAEAVLLIGHHIAGREDPSSARKYLDDALELLEKVDPSAYKLNLLSQGVLLASRVDKENMERIAGLIVKNTNGLPSAPADVIRGSEGHREYIQKVLYGSGHNIAVAFARLAEADVELAGMYARGIDRKDLRLIAEISVEKFRKYPLPKVEDYQG